jgi:hypothetical protein
MTIKSSARSVTVNDAPIKTAPNGEQSLRPARPSATVIVTDSGLAKLSDASSDGVPSAFGTEDFSGAALVHPTASSSYGRSALRGAILILSLGGPPSAFYRVNFSKH